jgi:hypothetical protein
MYLSCLWQTAAVLKVPTRQPEQQHWCCTVCRPTDHATQWEVLLHPPHLRSSYSPQSCKQATSGTAEFTQDSVSIGIFIPHSLVPYTLSLFECILRKSLSPHNETNKSHYCMMPFCRPFLSHIMNGNVTIYSYLDWKRLTSSGMWHHWMWWHLPIL